jgi:hypothetical protein
MRIKGTVHRIINAKDSELKAVMKDLVVGIKSEQVKRLLSLQYIIPLLGRGVQCRGFHSHMMPNIGKAVEMFAGFHGAVSLLFLVAS